MALHVEIINEDVIICGCIGYNIILLTTIILDRATTKQQRCDSIARKTSEVQNMKFKPNRKIEYTDDELQLLLHLRRKGGHVKPSKKTYNRKQKHKSKDF